MFAGSTSPLSRSYATRSNELPAANGSTCLGLSARDNGHSRVPDPPARITTFRMRKNPTWPTDQTTPSAGLVLLGDLAGHALRDDRRRGRGRETEVSHVGRHLGAARDPDRLGLAVDPGGGSVGQPEAIAKPAVEIGRPQ